CARARSTVVPAVYAMDYW
nr:immunoglobulin heavy chain junction region [Mus musculus]